MAEEIIAPVVETPAKPAGAPAEPPAGAPERDPNKVYTQTEIDSITAKVRKNERYRTRKEIEAYYQGRESVAQPKAAEAVREAPAEEKAPERGNYESYEEYLDARAGYTGRKAAREERVKATREESERKTSEERAQRGQKFQESVRTKFPDIDSRLGEVADMPMYRGVQEAITESEFGAELFSELVSNPAEFERLSKMSETSAVREIGKMEARIEAAARALKPEGAPVEPANPDPKAVKEPSKAPTPIRPVAAAKAASGDGEPSPDKPEEWARWRNRQIHKRKTGL